MTKLCGIEGCNRPHAARGLCAACYARCNREGAFQTRVRVKLDPAKAKQIRALRSRGVLAREGRRAPRLMSKVLVDPLLSEGWDA